MGIMIRVTLKTLPLELTDHIYADISFLAARPPSAAPPQKIPQPHGRMCLIPQHQRLLRLSRDGTLVLARECPFDMVRARQEPLGWFHRKQSPDRARVTPSQAAHVPAVLPHLRSRSVEVSVLENRHHTVAWTFPWDAPFGCALLRLASGTSCIVPFLILRTGNGNYGLDPDFLAFVVPARDPRPLVARHTLIRFGSFHAPTPQGLLLSTGRSGYPRRGTCLSVQLFPTLFWQMGLIDERRDPWRAFLSCSSNADTVRSSTHLELDTCPAPDEH